MDPLLISTILQTLSIFAPAAGKPEYGRTLAALAMMVKSGQNIDNHLQAVAERLSEGLMPDWDSVTLRVEQLRNQLHKD